MISFTVKMNKNHRNKKFTSFYYILDKIKYLTLTDPGRVWMPDTFFRYKYIFLTQIWFGE